MTEVILSAAAAGTLTVSAKAMATVARPHIDKIAIGAGGLAAAGGAAYGAHKAVEADVKSLFENEKAAAKPQLNSAAMAGLTAGGAIATGIGGAVSLGPVSSKWRMVAAATALTGVATLAATGATWFPAEAKLKSDVDQWRSDNPALVDKAPAAPSPAKGSDGAQSGGDTGVLDTDPAFDTYGLPNERIVAVISNMFGSDASEQTALNVLRDTTLNTGELEMYLGTIERTFGSDNSEYTAMKEFLTTPRTPAEFDKLTTAVADTFSSDNSEYAVLQELHDNSRTVDELVSILSTVSGAFTSNNFEHTALQAVLSSDRTAAEVTTIVDRVTQLYSNDNAQYQAMLEAL